MTRYSQDGPGRWDFLHQPRPALKTIQPPIQRASVLFPVGQSGRSVELTTHPHLAPNLKKRATLVLPLLQSSWSALGRLLSFNNCLFTSWLYSLMIHHKTCITTRNTNTMPKLYITAEHNSIKSSKIIQLNTCLLKCWLSSSSSHNLKNTSFFIQNWVMNIWEFL